MRPEFREALRVLWLSTLTTLLIVSLSVLQPRLYIAQRTYLMLAARAVIALLIPQFVYLLAVTPYKGSSMVTTSLAGFWGVWFWNTRWMGEQVGGAAGLFLLAYLVWHFQMAGATHTMAGSPYLLGQPCMLHIRPCLYLKALPGIVKRRGSNTQALSSGLCRVVSAPQVSALGFTNTLSVELVLVPASMLVDILNNPRLCRWVRL